MANEMTMMTTTNMRKLSWPPPVMFYWCPMLALLPSHSARSRAPSRGWAGKQCGELRAPAPRPRRRHLELPWVARADPRSRRRCGILPCEGTTGGHRCGRGSDAILICNAACGCTGAGLSHRRADVQATCEALLAGVFDAALGRAHGETSMSRPKRPPTSLLPWAPARGMTWSPALPLPPAPHPPPRATPGACETAWIRSSPAWPCMRL